MKDAHVHALPFFRRKGAEDPPFVPPLQAGVATCTDHLIMWDPRQLSTQIGDTTTLSTSFLDHKGVIGTIRIPVLTEEASAPPPPKTPRVPTLLFPVPEHAMETWRSQVAVDSSTAITLSPAMSRSRLYCMFGDNHGRGEPPPHPQELKSAILSIANDLQTILGEVMETPIAIFLRNRLLRHGELFPIISGPNRPGTALLTPADE